MNRRGNGVYVRAFRYCSRGCRTSSLPAGSASPTPLGCNGANPPRARGGLSPSAIAPSPSGNGRDWPALQRVILRLPRSLS
eukprot:3546959-Prymnesium_polylepis.1